MKVVINCGNESDILKGKQVVSLVKRLSNKFFQFFLPHAVSNCLLFRDVSGDQAKSWNFQMKNSGRVCMGKFFTFEDISSISGAGWVEKCNYWECKG